MRLIHYFIIIFIVILFNLVFEITLNGRQSGVKEKFTPSYQDCISSGYTKEFCSQTPTSVLGPSGCLCRDGSIGRILPGFGGRCVCSNILINQF